MLLPNSPAVGRKQRNTMATVKRKNTRKSTNTGTSTRVPATPASRNSVPANTVRSSRRLKHYTFRFSRNDTAHAAGLNGVWIEAKDGDTSFNLSLQEARSLYNFLSETLDG